MKRPVLSRPVPATSGFNKRRIVVASAVVVLTLGIVTFLLTRSSEGPIVRPEPAIDTGSLQPPRELLEDLPEAESAPPPIFEPDLGPFLGRPEPPETLPPPESEISDRVKRAFSEPIAYSRRRQPPGLARRSPGSPTSDLSSVFADFEEHNRALGELLRNPPTTLSAGSLERLQETLGPGTPETASRKAPATHHRQARLQAPAGPFLLRQGTVIRAQLLTEINSDLPGQVLAHISSDVRDSLNYRHLLLPRGTKLVGAYDSGLEIGQNRLAVVWIRFLLPDGSAIDVSDLPAVDAQGRSGLNDRVDHHTARIFGNALLLSLLSAGFEAAQPGGNELGLSAGELAIGGASRELERASAEILRRNGSIPPTVRIRAGTAFNVFLTGDLTFAEPYS
ncbi:MAG: TrbI/VirB10 family protein [bacterium]|nr:TrbI/VirB10 family protein [bacterium]